MYATSTALNMLVIFAKQGLLANVRDSHRPV